MKFIGPLGADGSAGAESDGFCAGWGAGCTGGAGGAGGTGGVGGTGRTGGVGGTGRTGADC